MCAAIAEGRYSAGGDENEEFLGYYRCFSRSGRMSLGDFCSRAGSTKGSYRCPEKRITTAAEGIVAAVRSRYTHLTHCAILVL
jgi:hypothetical protein